MTKQGGFTLIEALVALLILSLGMMGIAAMQLNALHSATRSYQHSVATLAAVDAQERLWEKLEKADDCNKNEVKLSKVRKSWKKSWHKTAPLLAAELDIASPKDCTYIITINLDNAENDDDEGYSTVTYRVRLPEK